MEGVLLFVILYWYTGTPRPRWSSAGLFLLGYGVFRSIAEFFREPDAHIGFDALGWLTRGQLLSLPMIVAGLAIIIWAYRRDART
jgi:phosphatidylglycerol:prolipoprotein diacylglycerol transferase